MIERVNPPFRWGHDWMRKMTPSIPIFSSRINALQDLRGGVNVGCDFTSNGQCSGGQRRPSSHSGRTTGAAATAVALAGSRAAKVLKLTPSFFSGIVQIAFWPFTSSLNIQTKRSASDSLRLTACRKAQPTDMMLSPSSRGLHRGVPQSASHNPVHGCRWQEAGRLYRNQQNELGNVQGCTGSWKELQSQWHRHLRVQPAGERAFKASASEILVFRLIN